MTNKTCQSHICHVSYPLPLSISRKFFLFPDSIKSHLDCCCIEASSDPRSDLRVRRAAFHVKSSHVMSSYLAPAKTGLAERNCVRESCSRPSSSVALRFAASGFCFYEWAGKHKQNDLPPLVMADIHVRWMGLTLLGFKACQLT